jgi:hypothetical protein
MNPRVTEKMQPSKLAKEEILGYITAGKATAKY